MAIDLGDTRTGVAVSDATRTLAGHTETVVSRRTDDLLKRVSELARTHGACTVVVGFPKNMNGTEGPRAAMARDFADKLRQALPDTDVTLWDERVTTVQAHSIMNTTNTRGAKRKATVDALAAALILEGYLGSLRNL